MTYLSSKKTVYEIKEDSPNPDEKDVQATPITVIVKELDKPTRMKPKAADKTTKIIRKLKIKRC